ncbi:MAG: metal ABC transporter ATP-binding protein [Paramuribaculum sp.]|nr:metal ABC transporter ATP-binding protein [Paramuribaculum sp.]MDE6323756.1 metal ABC transporter ATP-binding protein [Paramuribaculum sp.]MDE6488996.1 metal ABC transporter ATP-binding protein [Paramuribaculum sp.]
MKSEHNPVITLSGVSMIREKKQILSDVSLSVGRGDFIAITGPNGGGKTTLLRIMLRLLKPTAGTVCYFDDDGHPADRLSIGYLPQKNMIDARFPISVSEVVELGISEKSRLSRTDRRRLVGEMVDMVGLADKADAGIGSLSGGQLQRALMARAIISRPAVLVLDEPLSYVDRRFERRIYEIVENLSKTTTIILVSHDMTTIASMANRHLIVDRTIEECHSGSHFLHYDCCDSHS